CWNPSRGTPLPGEGRPASPQMVPSSCGTPAGSSPSAPARFGSLVGMTETGAATATDPRRTGSLRRLGYRLLPGDAFSYILHLRPREWPIVAGHTLFGFLLAATEQSGVLLQVQTAILGT